MITFNHTWPEEDVHCTGHHSTDITPFHYDIFSSSSDSSSNDSSTNIDSKDNNKSKKSNAADGDTHSKNNKNTKTNRNTNANQNNNNHNHENTSNNNIGNKSKQKKLHYLSNIDLYRLLDPSSDVFPYLYDSLLWTHCEVLGE